MKHDAYIAVFQPTEKGTGRKGKKKQEKSANRIITLLSSSRGTHMRVSASFFPEYFCKLEFIVPCDTMPQFLYFERLKFTDTQINSFK